MFPVFVLFLLLTRALAQDANCDFFQNVQPGQVYTIASPRDDIYGNYGPNKMCRWQAVCPPGYRCRVDCYVEIPTSSGCQLDALLISVTGDPFLRNANRYCNRLTLTNIVSANQNISFGLVSVYNSPGGNFVCYLSAQQVQQPPPCRCGIINSNRIVGGTPTGPHEFTMMAGLMDAGTQRIFCGAVILSNRYILTAAHCVYDRTASTIRVSIGDRDYRNGQIFTVAGITIHPNFNDNNYDYDIAVLRLVNNITFTSFTSPVCLPFKFQNADLTGAPVVLLGWGTTSFGGPTSNTLLKTNTTIISQTECSRVQAVTGRQVCTRTPGRDACQNDSGGPVILIDPSNGLGTSMGTISYGNSCGTNSPSVNTRLTVLLSWIVNNAPADYCVVP